MADTVAEARSSDNSIRRNSKKSSVTLEKLEKLTKKDDKAMESRIKDYIASWEDYQNFVSRVDTWYGRNEKNYLRYMSLYSREYLTETEFKLGFHDLKTPFSETEIHLLYQMLDPKQSGYVEYTKLYEAVWIALAGKFISDEDTRNLDLERPDKWILMTFKVPSCDSFDTPTTFEHLIDLSYTGTMLRELIISRVPCLSSRSIIIFTDVSRYTETVVHCNQRLYDFDYQGGPKCAPQEAIIYYEFSMGRIDCQLLCYSKSLDFRKSNSISAPELLPTLSNKTI